MRFIFVFLLFVCVDLIRKTAQLFYNLVSVKRAGSVLILAAKQTTNDKLK